MDLAFSSRKLRQICETEESARQEFGRKVAQKLKMRLADMRAASTPDELLVGNPRITHCSSDECMTIDLCGGFVIQFSANHPVPPRTDSGDLNWSNVTRIKIVEIGQSND